MKQFIKNHKNWFHHLVGWLIVLSVTAFLLWTNALEKNGNIGTTMLLAIIPCLCLSGFCEFISPYLKLGRNTLFGVCKNAIPTIIATALCLIFGADNIFELIKLTCNILL